MPQPAHVILPHVLHVTARHIAAGAFAKGFDWASRRQKTRIACALACTVVTLHVTRYTRVRGRKPHALDGCARVRLEHCNLLGHCPGHAHNARCCFELHLGQTSRAMRQVVIPHATERRVRRCE
jgi:hypothetical protein